MSSIICGSNQNRSSRLGLGKSNVLCFARIRAGDLRSSPSGNPRPVAEVTLSRPLSPAHSLGFTLASGMFFRSIALAVTHVFAPLHTPPSTAMDLPLAGPPTISPRNFAHQIQHEVAQ